MGGFAYECETCGSRLLRLDGKFWHVGDPLHLSAIASSVDQCKNQLVEEGRPYADLCHQLKVMCEVWSVSAWASWGFYDLHMFERMCDQSAVLYPLPPEHLNIKTLEARLMGRRSGKGLPKALETWGLKFEGRPHNAKADAINTARLYARMLGRGRDRHTGDG